MANMGLHRLILVEPAPALGGVARGFGVGGWPILEACERYSSFAAAVAPFHRLVGTASSRARPLRRTPPLAPRQLATFLADDPPGSETAIVFGCESSGLKRQDLERCHPIVSIPCAAEQPTLNLAQAVLIVAYELFLSRQGTPPGATASLEVEDPPSPLATQEDLEILMQGTSHTLRQIGYDQEHILLNVLRDLRRLAVRSRISHHETRILRRLLNRARAVLARLDR